MQYNGYCLNLELCTVTVVIDTMLLCSLASWKQTCSRARSVLEGCGLICVCVPECSFRWFGKCWLVHNLLKYEFDVEFDVSLITGQMAVYSYILSLLFYRYQ